MILLAALALAVVFLALCIGAKSGVMGLVLDPTIRPIELATLLITGFIAFFVQSFLASQITDLRAEKDLLISNVRDSLSALRGCREAFSGLFESRTPPKAQQGDMLSLVRRLANSIECVETAVAQSQCSSVARRHGGLMGMYLNYKAAVTGGSFPSKPYGAAAVSDHDRAYKALHAELQAYLFDLNRYH